MVRYIYLLVVLAMALLTAFFIYTFQAEETSDEDVSAIPEASLVKLEKCPVPSSGMVPFRLEMGAVDFNEEGTAKFLATKLPEVQFTVGLQIVSKSGPLSDEAVKKMAAPLKLRIRERGQADALVDVQGPIREKWWLETDSTSAKSGFLYYMESLKSSAFQPGGDREYIIEFSHPAAPGMAKSYTAELIAKTGGCK